MDWIGLDWIGLDWIGSQRNHNGLYVNNEGRVPEIVEVLLGPKNDKKIAPLRGASIFVNVEDFFSNDRVPFPLIPTICRRQRFWKPSSRLCSEIVKQRLLKLYKSLDSINAEKIRNFPCHVNAERFHTALH